MAQTEKNLLAMQVTWVLSLDGEDPWRRKWQPTPVSLPGEFHGQRSLVGYSPRDRKESDTTERRHVTHFILYHWRRKWQPTPVFSPGKSHGQRSLAGHGSWGRRELDTADVTKHPCTPSSYRSYFLAYINFLFSNELLAR